jgi:isopropylmalate/homocitrate/citramalate synthase
MRHHTPRAIEPRIVEPQSYTQGLIPANRPVRLYDTTLRDGEQSPGVMFQPHVKLRIAKELSRIGCHIVDLGFPAVGADEREALRLVLAARRRGEIRHDLEIVVMSRADERDIRLTADAISALGDDPADVTVMVFTATSALHASVKLGDRLKRYMHADARATRIASPDVYLRANCELIKESFEAARRCGFRRVEFGAEDASRTPVDWLVRLFKTAENQGAVRIIFADTVGCLTPEATRSICGTLAREIHDAELVNHFHNDCGLATANVIAAVQSGVTTCSVTINGIGERAGNASLHAVAVSLKYLYGCSIEGFDYERLTALSQIVESESGIPIPMHEPVIGMNAFRHESGIHVHGVLLNPRMYEEIPCDEVGQERHLVFGKHSGSHGVRAALRPVVDEETVKNVLAWIKKTVNERAGETAVERRSRIDGYRDYARRFAFSEADIRRIAVRAFGVLRHGRVASDVA